MELWSYLIFQQIHILSYSDLFINKIFKNICTSFRTSLMNAQLSIDIHMWKFMHVGK